MKRIYLLMILFIAFAGNAMAQRTCDIKVTLTKPTASTVLNPGGSFDVYALIQNVGPDSIKSATDTIMWYMAIQNQLVSITLGNPPQTGTIWYNFNRRMNAGDTFSRSFTGLTPNGYTGEADSQRTFCFYAVPLGKAGDTIRDPNLTPIASSNNRACVTFTWKKTTSIEDVEGIGTNNVKVFPNPAQSYTTFSFNADRASEVNVEVLDITGRTVLSVDKGQMSMGEHQFKINTDQLAPGTYVYRLNVGNDMTMGRLVIQ